MGGKVCCLDTSQHDCEIYHNARYLSDFGARAWPQGRLYGEGEVVMLGKLFLIALLAGLIYIDYISIKGWIEENGRREEAGRNARSNNQGGGEFQSPPP